jgi:hypothetical protein
MDGRALYLKARRRVSRHPGRIALPALRAGGDGAALSGIMKSLIAMGYGRRTARKNIPSLRLTLNDGDDTTCIRRFASIDEKIGARARMAASNDRARATILRR